MDNIMATEKSLSLIQSLYVAYYGRPADPAGLEFWANTLELNNGDIQVILPDFGNSPEFVKRFGNMDNTSLIDNLYQQMFGRNAEPEGLDFYSGLLVNGQLSLAQIAQSILNGAQSLDRQVAEGRVKAATAFTQELDTPEENAAYGTSRGIEIGKAYLQQVTASNGVVPVLGKVVETVATLLPTTPAPTPGGGSGGGAAPAPAPTFEVKVDSGVLSFGGTQTGDIIVTEGHLEVIFTRGALSQTLSAADYVTVTDVSIGSASVTTPAIAINGLIVTGTGSLVLLGVDDSLDLSGIASSLNVTARVDADLDLTQAPNLSTVDTFVLNTGVTLTLNASQIGAVGISGNGSYVLQDEATALLGLDDAVLSGAVLVVVTGEPELTQLAGLIDKGVDIADIAYDTVAGTAIELQADAATNSNAGTFVTDGKNVLVTDSTTVAQLDTVKSAIGSGNVTAADIADDVGNLITSGTASIYIVVGTNVTVNDAASVAQIAILDAANGTGSASGSLTYTLDDTLAHLLAADDSLVTGATSITLSGGLNLGNVSVAELQKVLSWSQLNGSGVAYTDLTYNLVDTAANLVSRGNVDQFVVHASAVTANTPASVFQATTLYQLKSTATYNITDSAWSLASTNADAVTAITQAVDLIATGTATAAQATTILSRDGSAGDVTYDVWDTYANLWANQAGANAARDVTVSQGGYLSAGQAQDIVGLNNSGKTTLSSIRDTAAAINTFVGGNQENSELSYSFRVQDSATNIIAQINANNLHFATGNAAIGLGGDNRVDMIEVTGTFDVANAQTFWNAINPVFDSNAAITAGKTYYTMSDTLANYTNAAAAHDGIKHADGRTINADTAANVYAAQTSSANPNHDIFNILAGQHGTSLDSLIIAAGSAGEQIIQGTKGSDTLRGGDGNDTLYGNDGADTIYGGNNGWDTLFGGNGRDTIFAGDNGAVTGGGASNQFVNRIYGGNDGDNMFGSDQRDNFIFTGATKAALIAESGTQWHTRDYITHFSQGDTITFQGAQTLQFLGTGSGNNASPVTAGSLGLSIRYDKGLEVQNWNGNGTVSATLVSIDIADAYGRFDNVADMHIVLVGAIDINAAGNSITFGA